MKLKRTELVCMCAMGCGSYDVVSVVSSSLCLVFDGETSHFSTNGFIRLDLTWLYQ